MSRETERDLAAMVKVEKRAKETARAERDDLRRQLAEERQRASAAEFAVAQLRDEAADLRRQLMAVAIDRNQLRSLWLEYRQRLADLRQQLDRERLAAIQHAIWSHWMTYQFSVCLRNDDGTMTIPAQKVARWERQASTPYSRLPESERESDRHQADRILADDSPATGEGDA